MTATVGFDHSAVMLELSTTALLLAAFGLLLVASVITNRTLERLGIPVLLSFLCLGMLAGSEGPGGIPFNDYRFAFRIGTMALILILFEGGLNTPWISVQKCIKPSAFLATLGVVGTAGLVAVFSRLLGVPWPVALLVGAVVSSTDAAAVFSVLRGGRIRLVERVGTIIELESGFNDPMAVILTLAVTESLMGNPQSGWTLAWEVPLQLAIGLAVGVALGIGARALLLRIRLSTGALYPVLTLGVAFLAFGLGTMFHGSGFLAVFMAGIMLGNGPIPFRSGLRRIHDALAWLSQIAMFVMLGLLVFPSQLLRVAPVGLAIGLFLAFVARPMCVFLCLWPFRFSNREMAFIGWVGLRGAVPIILAMFPVMAAVPGAMDAFNIVFFVVVLNALIPGATIRAATKRLGFEEPAPPVPLAALEINSTRLLSGELMTFYISPSLAVCDAQLSQIPFPPGSSVILIVRGEELMAARGDTRLSEGDHVYVFSQPTDKTFIEFLFGRSDAES